MESWVHPNETHVKPFDAISKWIGYDHDVCCADYDTYLDDEYSTWNSLAKDLNVGFIPTATPGFHATRPSQLSEPILTRSQEQFSEELAIGRKYLDANLSMMLVSTFNDWAENTCIEPTVEEGLEYLQTLKTWLGV